MKRLTLIPILLLLFFVFNPHIKRVKGFSVDKVRSFAHPVDAKYNTFDSKPSLDQTFYYFSSGTAMYAFVSEDQRYVLKLFKQRHMRPFSTFEKFIGYPLIPAKKRSLQKRLQFRKRIFDSCMMAYSKFRTQTGLIYMHLNPTSELKTSLHLVDQNGRHLKLDADRTEFYIQRKGDDVFNSIKKWYCAGERDTIRSAFNSLIELIIERCKKEIGDYDNCAKNFAFIDGKAIEIDIGEFWNDPGVKGQVHINAHLIAATFDLRKYLEKYYPELLDDLDEILRQYGAI